MRTLNLTAVKMQIAEEDAICAIGTTSFFKFQISESVQDILNEILNDNNATWRGYRDLNRKKLILEDKFSGWKTSLQIIDNDHIVVNCMNNKYHYFITNVGDGSASVEFNGSLAALLQQEIIPSMTYLPGTLRAMYEGMYSFIAIDDYCEIRKSRNGDETEKGIFINIRFNNELNCFAKAI